MGNWEVKSLNKDDFDMDWVAIKEHLITSSKIINDKEVVFIKITKSLFYQMKFNGIG